MKALFSQSNQRLLVYSRRKRFSKKGNLHVRNRAYSKNTMKYFAVCTPYLSYTTMLITSVESLSLEPRLDTAKSLSSSCKKIFHYYRGLTYFLCQWKAYITYLRLNRNVSKIKFGTKKLAFLVLSKGLWA